MKFGLKNKFALVTGGSHGIGRAIALSLAGEGVNVAICARDHKKIAQVAAEIKKRGVMALGIAADVTVKEDTEKAFNTIFKSWGKLHILINNVGGGGRWGEEIIENTPEEVYRDIYDKNVLAAIRFTSMFIPLMKKQRWGRVVTISSIHGKEGGAKPWFAMAKSAEIALMKSLSKDKKLVRCGITFNSIAPGAIMIPQTGWDLEKKKSPKGFGKMIDEKFPLGRLGTPQEVASVVTFVCSEAANLVNGATITVDGGESNSF